MLKRNVAITIVAITVSVILCTLGFKTAQTPIESIAVIWPGAILHSVGSILFGGWGLVATILAGVIVDIVNVGKLPIIFGFMVPDFLQPLIPVMYYRYLIARHGWNSEVFRFRHFLIFAVLIPNALGALTGTLILRMNFVSDLPFWFPFVRWMVANVPISLCLGYPLLRCLGPTLAEEGFVVTRWWR